MVSYIVLSIVSGILFGIMDAIINANPLGKKLLEAYKSIAKTSINIPAGIVIDLIYGFLIAGIFLIIYNGLPGEAGIIKGISFAALAWFFRVVMSVASNWMMFKIPARTLIYQLLTGLGEILVLGILYGIYLKPWA